MLDRPYGGTNAVEARRAGPRVVDERDQFPRRVARVEALAHRGERARAVGLDATEGVAPHVADNRAAAAGTSRGAAASLPAAAVAAWGLRQAAAARVDKSMTRCLRGSANVHVRNANDSPEVGRPAFEPSCAHGAPPSVFVN